MSSLASTRQLLEAFNFQLSLDGGTNTGFSRISQLSATVSVDMYQEGGSTLPIKDPGSVAYENITLETGLSSDSTFYDWLTSIIKTLNGSGSGLPTPVDKRNATIYCLNRDKSIAKRIHLYNAFPVQYIGGEWDNNEDKVLIEKLTIAYDYFDVVDS